MMTASAMELPACRHLPIADRLFLEAANGTKFVGSPTAGANGDVTTVLLPGGARMTFSGHAVRHADGRQLQRLGLEPDVPVRQTIAGVRAGICMMALPTSIRDVCAATQASTVGASEP